MSASGLRAIGRNEARLARHDPIPWVMSLAMPLVVMAFIKPAFRASLVASGDPHATGAEQAVPGVAVMFSIFLLTNLGFSIFAEHGWHTWARLRTAGITRIQLLAGKGLVPLVTAWLQLATLFVVGGWLFQLRVSGSVWAIVAVAITFACCLVALGMLLAGLVTTLRQFSATVNLGAVLFAGLGGALTPIDLLPHWAQTLARLTPSYWAMRGFRTAILDGGGLTAVRLPVLVLSVTAAVAAVAAVMRFDVTADKVHVS